MCCSRGLNCSSGGLVNSDFIFTFISMQFRLSFPLEISIVGDASHARWAVGAMEDLGFLGSAAVRLIAETFVEARHLDAAFDDEADAKELLSSILPASTSGEFLDTAAAGLMRWKKVSESFLKR